VDVSFIRTSGETICDRYSPIPLLNCLEDLLNQILEASPPRGPNQMGGADRGRVGGSDKGGTSGRSSLEIDSESDVRHDSSTARSLTSSSLCPSSSSSSLCPSTLSSTAVVSPALLSPSPSVASTPFITLGSCTVRYFRWYIAEKCQTYSQDFVSLLTLLSGHGYDIMDLRAPSRTVDTAIHGALISSAASSVFNTILRNLLRCELHPPVNNAASSRVSVPACENPLRSQNGITVLRCWLYLLDALGSALMRDLLHSMEDDEVLLIAESCLDFLLSRRAERITGVRCSTAGFDSSEGVNREELVKDSSSHKANGLLSTYEQCINSTLRSILHSWSESKRSDKSNEARVGKLDGEVEMDRTDMDIDSETRCSGSASGHIDSAGMRGESEYSHLLQSIRSARTAWVLIGCGDLYNHQAEVEVEVDAEVEIGAVKLHRGSGSESLKEQGDRKQGERG
jgi:hypothetical protein